MIDLTATAAATFTAVEAGPQRSQSRRCWIKPLAAALPEGCTRELLLRWCDRAMSSSDLEERCALRYCSGACGDPNQERRQAELYAVRAALAESARVAVEYAGRAAVQIARHAEALTAARYAGIPPGAPGAVEVFENTFLAVCSACVLSYARSSAEPS